MRFWVGGYAADMEGAATGIGALVAGEADAALAGGPLGFTPDAAAVDGSPSWIGRHPTLDVVYAALEASGLVQAFRRAGESSLVRLGPPVEVGELVCHLAASPDGRALYAACWGDGRVVRLGLDAEGRPSAPVAAPAASDPYAADGASEPAGPGAGAASAAGIDLAAAARALRDAAGEEYGHLLPGVPDSPIVPVPDEDAAGSREAGRVSRAHQTAFLTAGLVATTDMGLDLVRLWRAGPAGFAAAGSVRLPRGSGPRHMLWHPSGHLYVVTELSCEVFVLAAEPSGAWRIVAGSSLGAGLVSGDLAAELAASRDGEFLYAGLRGSNTVATLRVRGAGEALSPVALVDAGVDWPRHHVVARDTLLVAGQQSNEIVSLGLDERTGVPGPVRHRVEAPSPTCILPAR